MRKSERYLLPDGYVGWVLIVYDVPSAARFSMEEGFRLVPVPEKGVVETGDGPFDDTYWRELYYVNANDRRRKIPAPIAGFTAGYQGRRAFYFFVGTEDDLQKANSAQGASAMPKPGRISSE